MKIGLLSDIHGNDIALSTVLAAARKRNVSQLMIAGDFVGYYHNIRNVLRLLSDWEWIGISGNHEGMLAQLAESGDKKGRIRLRYGTALEKTLEVLTEREVKFLISLPSKRHLIVNGTPILICHGSPWDRDCYVYPDAPISSLDRFLQGTDAQIVVYGHTHYPTIYRRDSRVIVNPGSVGQTRDRIPGACWAVWDTSSGKIDLLREAYDPSPIVAQCIASDPDLPYLHQVLKRTVND